MLGYSALGLWASRPAQVRFALQVPSPLFFIPIEVFAAILRMLPSPRCASLRLRCVSKGMRTAVDDAFFLAHGPASQRNRGVVAVPPRIFLCPGRPAQARITAPSLMRARRLMAAPSCPTEPHLAGGFRIHVLCRRWPNPFGVFPDRAHVAALAAFLRTEPCATVELIVDESFSLAGASAFRARPDRIWNTCRNSSGKLCASRQVSSIQSLSLTSSRPMPPLGTAN